MKKFDITVQSILVWPIIMLLTMSVLIPNSKDLILIVMWIQLLLGPWQVTSSLIRLIAQWKFNNHPHYTKLIIYIGLVCTYFLFLFFVPNHEYFGLILIYAILPNAIGLYYYYTIIKSPLRPARKKLSGFLPHISF